MATKQFHIDDMGVVHITKRRSSKNIKMSLGADGSIRVSIPWWVSYASGLKYIKSNSEWVNSNKPPTNLITDGYQVGKAHHIKFESSSGDNITTRIKGNQVLVMLPVGINWKSEAAQSKARAGVIKGLKKEASALLPKRLETLAQSKSYNYKNVQIKQLKGRWGSCSAKQEIVLNCFLMKLPWELIDYVLLHELAHTKHMSHGVNFWNELESSCPGAKQLKKQMRQYSPVV